MRLPFVFSAAVSLSCALLGCDRRVAVADSGALDLGTAESGASEDAGTSALDCVSNGGTCVGTGQGLPGCGDGGHGGGGLICAVPAGNTPEMCCLFTPPDVCEGRTGACVAPSFPCPTYLVELDAGCERSGLLSKCCVPRSECMKAGGSCIAGAATDTDCAQALGDAGYRIERESPNMLCPQYNGPAACCSLTPDDCTKHGGDCYASQPMICSDETPYACDRPTAGGVLSWHCCGAK